MRLFGILSGGSIAIRTDKVSYALGETVNAEFILKLGGPTKARGLSARICAFEFSKHTVHHTDSHGHHSDRTETRRHDLFSNVVQLGGAQEYPAGETAYKASFAIPPDRNLLSQPGMLNLGPLGSIGARNISWEITAKLDVAMAFDVGGRTGLSVHG